MSSSISDQQLAERCYHQWMILQEQRLNQLMETLSLDPDDDGDRDGENDSKEAKLKRVVERMVRDFQDYIDVRSDMSRRAASKFFAPPWNTCLENSLLWICGCRPSCFLRLLYALCGSRTTAYVEEFLRDAAVAHRSSCEIVVDDLSAEQFVMVNDLQMKTVQEEDKLSRRLSSLQEKTVDIPIVTIAQGLSHVREVSTEADRALAEHETEMAELMAEADKLRMSTLKELKNILTPLQAVDFLAAGKKLHLCLHEWGKKRDQGFR